MAPKESHKHLHGFNNFKTNISTHINETKKNASGGGLVKFHEIEQIQMFKGIKKIIIGCGKWQVASGFCLSLVFFFSACKLWYYVNCLNDNTHKY